MKQTIGFHQFCEAFQNYDSLENFPNDGLSVLFNWLEEFEQDTGEEIELDVIALCCDFQQMTWEDIAREYQIDLNDAADLMEDAEEYAEACKEIVLEYLENNTCVVGECCNGSEVIFQSF